MSNTHPSLADLGWNDSLEHALAAYRDTHRPALPARVSRVDRGGADLITPAGPVRATYGRAVSSAMATDRTAVPTVGDWAALESWPDGRTTIEALLPRRTSVIRDGVDRTSHGQVLAANIDLVVVVEHLDPDPDLGRIERLLVLAWGSGADPLVILTKTDLVPDPQGMIEEVAAVAPGVDVLGVSATTHAGVDAVRERLQPGRTLVLLGPSGAGKSTLTNALAGTDLMATGGRRADGKGRHTTTHRELVVLPGLGVVLDTPGLRAVGLVADTDALDDAFPELIELAEQCRFRDCSHEVEPGCAVLAAVEDGTLDERRLASWRKLGREAAYQARRADARLMAAERAVWRRLHRQRREHDKLKPPRP